MLNEITSYCSGILASVLANESSNFVHKKMDNKMRQRLETEILVNIEEQVKDLFEQEQIKEWLFEQQYKLEQTVCLFSEGEKDKFIEDFFAQNRQLKNIHSARIENVIRKFLDDINKYINGILSAGEKVIIQSLKKEQNFQSDIIAGHIKRSEQEIIKKIEETQMIHRKENLDESRAEKEYSNNKELRKCCGFGERKGKCENFVGLGIGLCKECRELEYFERIENLYRIQNYFITKEEKFFCAEQKSGIIKSCALIIPFYSDKPEIRKEDIYELLIKMNGLKSIKKYQWIHIVSNIEFKCRDVFLQFDENVKIMSEYEVINGIMDFSTYFFNVISEYENNILQNHFIEVYDENTNEPLINSVDNFLNSEEKNGFLILGDYGCGKTSFLTNLSYKMSKAFLNGECDIIPLFIPLKDYVKSINFDSLFLNLFINNCRMSNISIDVFKMLIKYKRFVILFDGFDEVAKRVNYDVKYEIFNEICKYCTGQTKVIVTCRPNYFQDNREYKNLIQDAHLQFEPNTYNNAQFDDTYIAELNSSQIEQYIFSYSEELARKGIEPLQLQYWIDNTHDLMDLSKRPFLLNIIVQTLPVLIEELVDQESIKINAASLYKRYTDLWLQRENSKGKTLMRKEDKLHFCKYIAYKMFNNDLLSLHFSEFPKEIKEYFKDLSRIDEIDYFSHDIQSCSFMNSDGMGNFKFIHKSFMEYFVACHIATELKKIVQKDASIDKVLSVKGISSEIALFINDILEEDEIIHINVLKVLEENTNYNNENVRQNILTILSKMKYNLKGIIENYKSYAQEDFSHSLLEDAVIKNVDFSNATFYDAVLHNVTFINCVFANTYFQKATLKNVDFSSQLLEYADFSYSYLESCNFRNCILIQAQISQATISKSNFGDCDMSGIESEGTKYIHNYNLKSVIGIPYDMT